MEILRFLLSFLAKEYDGGKFSEIFNLMNKYDFDLKKVMENIKPEDLSPIMETFSQNKTPTETVGAFGLQPIKDLADKDVIYALNGYLG